MAKRAYFPILVLASSLLGLAGCNQDSGFTLALHSKAYSAGVSATGALSLDTYHRAGEGDVPYVKLSQYIVATGDAMSFNPYSITKNGSVFSVSYAEAEEEGSPKHEMFRFDVNSDSVTYLHDAKWQYRFYAKLDPYSEGMDAIFVPNKEKTTVKPLWETRTIDFSKYGFKLYENGGELYAPIGVFQSVFSDFAAPDGGKPLVFNGSDYYRLGSSTGVKASCLSSNLKFRYVDPTLLEISMGVTDAVINPTLDFQPVTPAAGEKYRFESNNVTMPSFTPPKGGEKRKVVPDLKARLSITVDGKGSYSFIDLATGNAITVPEVEIQPRAVQSLEDENAVFVAIMPSEGSTRGDMMRIHKKETFFGTKTRTKEYAQYDYNLIRLHFGEYYGLHDRKLPFDVEIAPYKDKLTSTSYDDYNEGMSKFLLGAVDDGHTSVTEYSIFGTKTFDATEKAKVNSEYMGYRKKGLLNLVDALKSARQASSVKPGLQIVGNTAYLTFDEFVSSSGSVKDYGGDPNLYAKSNTIAFAYTALKEVSTKHPEVKRIVYDLTCNGGGNVSTLPYLLATMSDDPALPVFSYYSGELVSAHYKVDLNGDGKFGEADDTYKGKYDFFILTSPFSFSCGNAFPGYAKAIKCAKVVGERSGGGGSMVDQVYTASGYGFNSSSMLTFATIDDKGNHIENDAGIPVDYQIPVAKWYTRDLLNAELDKIQNK